MHINLPVCDSCPESSIVSEEHLVYEGSWEVSYCVTWGHISLFIGKEMPNKYFDTEHVETVHRVIRIFVVCNSSEVVCL